MNQCNASDLISDRSWALTRRGTEGSLNATSALPGKDQKLCRKQRRSIHKNTTNFQLKLISSALALGVFRSALGQVRRDGGASGPGSCSTSASPFLYFPHRFSNIHRGLRVTAQFRGCQSRRSSGSTPRSAHLRLLIGNITPRRPLHQRGVNKMLVRSALHVLQSQRVGENKGHPKVT